MPTPEIDYLMGDSKKGVHCAEAYSYTLQDELAIEYRTFLLEALPIGKVLGIQRPFADHGVHHSSTRRMATSQVDELKEMLRESNRTISTLRTVIDSLSSKIHHSTS